jgi:ribosome biogenesis GTPase
MDGLVAVTTSAPWTSRRRVQGDFASLLAPAHTYALVGASGAGKSTLLNALVGEDLQATAEVRAGDGKGRHVTSFRELFALSSGALMIDTPGMREFGLWADDGGLERVFSDVLALAEECRFADCTHNTEPGCAVLGAVEEGCLARRRLENWRQLKTEMDENAGRRMIMQARRERGTLMRKKKRDKRFSGR